MNNCSLYAHVDTKASLGPRLEGPSRGHRRTFASVLVRMPGFYACYRYALNIKRDCSGLKTRGLSFLRLDLNDSLAVQRRHVGLGVSETSDVRGRDGRFQIVQLSLSQAELQRSESVLELGRGS